MASSDDIPDTSEGISQSDNAGSPEETSSASESTGQLLTLSIRNRDQSQKRSNRKKGKNSSEDSISVVVSGPQRPWEYTPYSGDTTVRQVLAESAGPNRSRWFTIEYESERVEKVSFDTLLQLKQGRAALDTYNSPSILGTMEKRTRSRKKVTNEGFVDSTAANLGSDDTTDDEPSYDNRPVKKTRTRLSTTASQTPIESGRTTRSKANPRRSTIVHEDNDEQEEDDTGVSSASDEDDDEIQYEKPSKKSLRHRQNMSKGNKQYGGTAAEAEGTGSSRRSGRNRGNKVSIYETDSELEMLADDVAVAHITAKIPNAREIFKEMPIDSIFRNMHSDQCDSCGLAGSDVEKHRGPLILCQGCTTSIHKGCLGTRTQRKHVVTKVGEDDYVLQCRRCVGAAGKKDHSAPRLNHCHVCNELGVSCEAFSKPPIPQKEPNRVDPITEVSPELLNNAANLFFRCTTCQRAYHIEHLPAPKNDQGNAPDDIEMLPDADFEVYHSRGVCNECAVAGKAVKALLAWRPREGATYEQGSGVHTLTEDEREYLVKWVGKSYRHCAWMPGAWVWGVVAPAMRRAFLKNEDKNYFPVSNAEDVIPEEYHRMEIVLDVKYEGNVSAENETQGRELIDKVKEVYVKFQGLSYEDVVWESPPDKEDQDRWNDYEEAFYEYLKGLFFTGLAKTTVNTRLAQFRSLHFENDIMLEDKKIIENGTDSLELMTHQLDGVNWLLYNFQTQKNVILADDMGLGKTIQIVAFIAALIKNNLKCWPFLVVTPNSTCPNWRREFKKWAPELRVVAFYGGKEPRDLITEYELFPVGKTGPKAKLAAHVVITSYECPVEADSREFFRSVNWMGLIVDEGQRLKNEKNLLYKSLRDLRTPFRTLLTGTPLQNTKRELFNLIQFLDPKKNAEALDEEFEEVTSENVSKIHKLIRPFFLRRTKEEVLPFLPPIGQVIIPVTMTLLQKKLCQSIVAKNSELVQSVLGQSANGRVDRGNLNNLMMQCRLVLSHPFIYNEAIEERSVDQIEVLRNFIDASAKFKLLELMLPKLKERGHRVLIFSQFLKQLDMVEDFMTGLGLSYLRLDGNLDALGKQKAIDAFNCDGSEVFAMLLSTRAGGVGINLATADTVIIMDPDFNPHQDQQALSRVHRIGQKKSVLVFQLMTKYSFEERMFMIAKKKLALDKALIESMNVEESGAIDVESIFRYAAAALFKDDDGTNDINYDSASVDALLDRSKLTKKEHNTAESLFSFAKIWVNDNAAPLPDNLETAGLSEEELKSAWSKIMQQRAEEQKLEADRTKETLGRGQRIRNHNPIYEATNADLDDADDTQKPQRPRKKGSKTQESDNDFHSNHGSPEPEGDSEPEGDADWNDLSSVPQGQPTGIRLKFPSRAMNSQSPTALQQTTVPENGKPLKRAKAAKGSKAKPAKGRKPRQAKAKTDKKAPPRSLADIQQIMAAARANRTSTLPEPRFKYRDDLLATCQPVVPGHPYMVLAPTPYPAAQEPPRASVPQESPQWSVNYTVPFAPMGPRIPSQTSVPASAPVAQMGGGPTLSSTKDSEDQEIQSQDPTS